MGMPRTAFAHALKPFYDFIEGVTSGQAERGVAPAVTGMTVSHEGVGQQRRTKFTFSSCAIAMVDAAGVVAYAGTKIFDFPAGKILFLGACANLALTKSSAGINDTFDGDFSLGTVTASNNATLSSTEQDLIPTTATPQAVSGATTAKGASTSTESCKVFDGTGTAIDAYLNFLIDDADHDVTGTPADLIVTGTLTIDWINLGDY